MEDRTPEKMNDLISLIEKEGLIVDEIDLPVSGFTKELLQKLFSAIGKWQPTLPGFVVINTGVFNIDNWVDSQQIKNTKRRIYNWSTDIFGNQYALFKDTLSMNGRSIRDTDDALK